MKRVTTTLAAAVLSAGALAAAPAGAEPPSPTLAHESATEATAEVDTSAASVVPVQVTGDPSNRWNLVVLGDGFTAEEMPEFRQRVEEHLNVMWSLEPFKSYRNYINVYAVEIPSPESGVSCDPDLSAPLKDTPLNMRFWSGCREDGIQRLLVMDNDAAQQYAALAPQADQILALANSDTYGGAGGSYATASAGNALSALISPHELAHSFGGLQDEYDYYARGETSGTYTGTEPRSVHHTLATEQEMRDQKLKWWRWLGERSESGGTIGRFEGGQYFTKGIWRPSQHSMMKSLGFYMDQVSREQMTAGLSGTVDLIENATDNAAPVPANRELWIETVHPVSHELDTTWSVDGSPVTKLDGDRSVSLADLGARPGDEVSVTVVDDTEFVRDPALRESEDMTETRTWTVGARETTPAPEVAPEVTLHTPDDDAVGAEDVLWVETSHPRDHAFAVEWRLGHRLIGRGGSVDLGSLRLRPGTHTVTAIVRDRQNKRAEPATVEWTVDNTSARTTAEVSDPIEVSRNGDRTPHYTVRGSFTLGLDSTDDQPGYVVREFRVDGDGWYHYFGSPEDASAPFLFTPTGTNVDDLIYGNLGTGGISVSPFAERTPGYGTHQIDYRSIDAAGNIADAQRFTVTVLPEEDPAPGDVPLETGAFTSCATDQTSVAVTATNLSRRKAAVTVSTPYGTRTFAKVSPRKSVTATFPTGAPTTENGIATVSASAGGEEATYDVPFNRFACS